MTTESPPTAGQIAFRIWFNQEQPLLHIQDEANKKIYDPALFRAIRGQIEAAFMAGWIECGRHTGASRDFDGNLPQRGD